jgi:hypothetical protein
VEEQEGVDDDHVEDPADLVPTVYDEMEVGVLHEGLACGRGVPANGDGSHGDIVVLPGLVEFHE